MSTDIIMLGRNSTVDLIKQVEAKTQSTPYRASSRSAVSVSEHLDRNDSYEALSKGANDAINIEQQSATKPEQLLLNYLPAAIDQFDYLRRLNAVLTYSDRHGGWIGLKNFINLYFSTVFHTFFGEQMAMHLIHIEKRTKFLAHFSLRSTTQAYRIIIMLNYNLWEKIILAASALPDLYFHLPERTYLDKAAASNSEADTIYIDQPADNETRTETEYRPPAHGRWYEVSLSALCLVHRLEMIMFTDLNYQHASHVVTLGKFFANHNDAKNPFVISTLYD